VALAATAVALIAWIAAPAHAITGGLMLIAGLVQATRLLRWAGDRTLADRLVLVLHVAYAFVPLGFVLIGASCLTAAVPASAGIHAWTAGAIGLMTLAVMTRASLGHTGHALQAGLATQTIYALVLLAAVMRIIAAFTGALALIDASGAAWIAGFALFVAAYGPLLVLRKPAWSAARG
jgi:uncharacterized protein involved in response to NO